MSIAYVAAVFIATLLSLCLTLPPAPGVVVAGFEPGERFEGHWGIDIRAEAGTEVVAPARGRVTFAGQVAGMRSVTVLVEERIRISLSYLSSVDVSVGDSVNAGSVIGRSGRAHGEDALHMSVRVGGSYVDPLAYLNCRSGTIRLIPDR